MGISKTSLHSNRMSLQYQFFQKIRAKNKARSKAYKKLMGISIPSRNKENLKEVQPDLWYIVWENNLIQPKIFKYSFISDYFAKTFATKYLSDTHYAIFKGQDLLDFGMVKAYINVRYTGSREKIDASYKYDWPIGLSKTRRKTMRTQYRRNLRRKLIKLFKNKKMADKFVLDKINHKPAAFFKKLRTQWFHECLYSQTFREWLINEEGWRLQEIDNASKGFQRPMCKIANIVVILEKDYNDAKFDYKNETYVSAAIKLYRLYQKRIEKYMKKKGYTPRLSIHNEQEAFKELVFRGWLPAMLLTEKMDPKKDFYLKATVGNLIWPNKYKDNNGANEAQINFGLTGYVGVNDPKVKY